MPLLFCFNYFFFYNAKVAKKLQLFYQYQGRMDSRHLLSHLLKQFLIGGINNIR